ncbi:MAG: aminoglycoside phosphotransferase family protein [Pseudomonadota bacterium]|jgi:streptomycin 6-kinase|nr:aminoglycoside phosphotransferase family protein [Alphaproteobacteria bacterium]
MTDFENTITCLYGDEGRLWLENLPNIVNNLAHRWQLSELHPIDNLSYNYVMSGWQKEKPIILKLGCDPKSFKNEIQALKAFKTFGAMTVLDQMEDVLLLERAQPGLSLKCYFPDHDLKAVSIACEVMKKLHTAPYPEYEFPTIKDWLTVLDKDHELFMPQLAKARVLKNELLNTMEHSILLHGDFHHENILEHEGEWKVIDPQGVIGERAYEVGCFMRNPKELIKHPDCLYFLKDRIHAFAKHLDLDPVRIAKWCYIQAMLSAVWSYEDNLSYESALKFVSLFEQLLDASWGF